MSADQVSSSAEDRISDSINAEGIITCPYCGDTVPSLKVVDTGMRLALKETAQFEEIPPAVCAGCHTLLARMVSKGAALRAQAQAKEQNRMMLWRSRVTLVKRAKDCLARKNFSDAAINYEKYIRVLEVVFDKPPGELTPNLFDKGKGQELTVLASVYWDLMRIYDTSPRYRDRQIKAAAKLAEFVRFTPIFSHVIRKAESQARTAKNPEAFRQFLAISNKNRPRCFIATAAFDDDQDPSIQTLRLFRDRVLRRHPYGRRFVRLYYRFSPALASRIAAWPSVCRAPLRAVLRMLAQASRSLFPVTPRPQTRVDRPKEASMTQVKP